MISSGFTTYGIDFTIGVSHEAKVAAAVENPKNFKKSLLEVDVSPRFLDKKSSNGNSSTNSSCANFSIAGSFSSCDIPFQYFLLQIFCYLFSEIHL